MRAPATDGLMSIGLSTRGDERRLGSLRCMYKFSSRKYSGDACCNGCASVVCVGFSFLVRGFVAFSELPKFSGFIEYDIALRLWFDVVILESPLVEPRHSHRDELGFRLEAFARPPLCGCVDLRWVRAIADGLLVGLQSGNSRV